MLLFNPSGVGVKRIFQNSLRLRVRRTILRLADDLSDGEEVSYRKSVNLKEDETVVFACIIYKDREHRDLVNKNSMEDPRMANFDVSNLPFDSKRMIWGGFKGFVE